MESLERVLGATSPSPRDPRRGLSDANGACRKLWPTSWGRLFHLNDILSPPPLVEVDDVACPPSLSLRELGGQSLRDAGEPHRKGVDDASFELGVGGPGLGGRTRRQIAGLRIRRRQLVVGPPKNLRNCGGR